MIDIERYTELIEEISDMQVAIKDRLNNIIKKYCETNPQKTLIEVDANYKKVNRLQQIDKCKDDIERYKKWILESEETLKKLEEDEELS